MEHIQTIERFIKTLPKDILATYGYGSGFFKQPGNEAIQYDLLLFYDENNITSAEWLHELVVKHKDYLPAHTQKIIDFNNETKTNKFLAWGSMANFFPYIHFENNLFKIGLSPYYKTLDNLKTWNQDLCIPHRLGKSLIPFQTNEDFAKAIQDNQRTFLTIALFLLQNEKVQMEELFYQYCELSYLGDIRTKFHLESKDKINKLVVSSKETLQTICDQNKDLLAFQNGMIKPMTWNLNNVIMPNDLELFLNKHCSLKTSELEIKKMLLQYLKQKNLAYSLPLAIKEIYLNGLDHSCNYVLDKAKKAFKPL